MKYTLDGCSENVLECPQIMLQVRESLFFWIEASSGIGSGKSQFRSNSPST